MRAAVLAVLALLLAGCETLPFEKPAREPSVAAPAPAEEAEAPREAEPPSEAAAPTRPPPGPMQRPDVTKVSELRLEGITPQQAEQLLGPPDGRGEEPPATVWTYVQPPCRLDLFFYFDLESQQQRALTFDLMPGTDAQGAYDFCLIALARRGAEAQRLDSAEELVPPDDGGDAPAAEPGAAAQPQSGETAPEADADTQQTPQQEGSEGE